MVYHEYKAIQLHIGKTGGTSIEKAFGFDPIEIHAKKHWRPEQIIATEGQEVWRTYFKFSFVRNPWDRLVSKYFFERDFKQRVPADCDFGRYVAQWAKQHPRWNQLSWFEGRLEEFDYVGRFETLQEGFQCICRQIKAELILPHSFRTTREHYSVYYDRKSRNQVAKISRDDIKLFGYTFETQ